ncbi:MAG: hypothetical protein AAF298_09400 [Cyanobacteria bacterium P01_A01_bin.40]
MNIPTFPLNAQTRLDEEFEDRTIEESTIETEENSRLNYIGVGGAIGLKDDGETALGEGGFSILGRVTFTNNFSVHTSAIFDENDLLSAAITYSKPIKIFYPFVGAGISTDTDDFNINPELTAGVDLPINSLLTGTARVNANFDDETDIGLLLGVGVNF